MSKRLWVSGAALIASGIAAVTILVKAGVGIPASWAFGKPKGDDKAAAALEFTAAEVTRPQFMAMPERIEFSGPLVAPNTAVVRAKASGTLMALEVAEGATVRAGQSLGRIDLAELNSRIAERGANLEAARAALAQAERNHASNERLAAQAFISPLALETSRSQVDSARAQSQAAQAALDSVRVGLREATLVAPIGGIVAKRHVVVGEKLAVEQPLLTIVDLARLELAGSVPTHLVPRLAPGMAAQVDVEGMAEPVAARIARIAPAAETGTRSIGVTLEIVKSGQTLRAGQYALARVRLPDGEKRLTVPMQALAESAGQDFVWVIDKGALLRRVVTLGRRDEAGGRVEVVSGLPADAQVLALRFDKLRDGAKAVVVDGGGAASAPAAAASSR